MRLDKYLADMNVGIRSELKKDIRGGAVTVNGIAVRDAGYQVREGDEVSYRGAPVRYEQYVYYMLHKPAGVISASEDGRHRTVVDLIADRARKDLFPVGRLDKDTEGLLLITNDGALAYRLLSPKKHVDKRYFARVRGRVTNEDVRRFAQGLEIAADFTALPAELTVLAVTQENRKCAGEKQPAGTEAASGGAALLSADGLPQDDRGAIVEPEVAAAVFSEVEVVIREGKFHQIKRMFEALGKEVVYLKRLSMGPLTLDAALAPGEYRRLTPEEEKALGIA